MKKLHKWKTSLRSQRNNGVITQSEYVEKVKAAREAHNQDMRKIAYG